MHSLELRIRQFLRDNFIFDDAASQQLDASASLLEQGILDSQGMMELVDFVETEWQIAVADAELIPEHFDTIAQIQQFILQKFRAVSQDSE